MNTVQNVIGVIQRAVVTMVNRMSMTLIPVITITAVVLVAYRLKDAKLDLPLIKIPIANPRNPKRKESLNLKYFEKLHYPSVGDSFQTALSYATKAICSSNLNS